MLVDKKLGERYCFHRKKGKAETLTKLKYISTESGDLEIEKGETEGKSVNMVCDRAIDKTGHPFECPHKSHYHGWNYRCLLNSHKVTNCVTHNIAKSPTRTDDTASCFRPFLMAYFQGAAMACTDQKRGQRWFN